LPSRRGRLDRHRHTLGASEASDPWSGPRRRAGPRAGHGDGDEASLACHLMRMPARPDRARARPLGTCVAVLAVIGACTIVVSPGAPAVAATTPATDVATLRAQADAIADEYFKAMTRSHELDD